MWNAAAVNINPVDSLNEGSAATLGPLLPPPFLRVCCCVKRLQFSTNVSAKKYETNAPFVRQGLP